MTTLPPVRGRLPHKTSGILVGQASRLPWDGWLGLITDY